MSIFFDIFRGKLVLPNKDLGNGAPGGGDYSPPIPQTDVSGLVSSLASKASTSYVDAQDTAIQTQLRNEMLLYASSLDRKSVV